jgi:hypothetical protein
LFERDQIQEHQKIKYKLIYESALSCTWLWSSEQEHEGTEAARVGASRSRPDSDQLRALRQAVLSLRAVNAQTRLRATATRSLPVRPLMQELAVAQQAFAVEETRIRSQDGSLLSL